MKLLRNLLPLSSLVFVTPLWAVDLIGVYELARTNDAELRAAELRRQAAEEVTVQARSALLPRLDGSANRTLGRSSPAIPGLDLESSDIDRESYSVRLSQSIYDDANYGRLDRGRAQVAAAEAQFAEAFQAFLFRVADRYFDVLTALDSVAFARAEESALRRQFEQAEQRFEVGLAAVTDVHEARAAFDGARARGIVAENRLEDAREALRETTGTQFENFARLIDEVPLNEPNPGNVEQWIEFALAGNPRVLRQISEVDVASADVRVARGGFLPTLSLTGQISRNVDNEFVARDPATQQLLGVLSLTTDGWQVGLTLDVPIFQGFATQSRHRQAGLNLSAADEDLDLTQRAVVRQTENAFRAVLAGIREVEARHQALVSAESALEATNAGFEVGTRTIVDVLLSEQRFFQAERDYSQARHQFILNQLLLRQAAGRLTENDLVEVNRLLR